jgi:hypothetical protein
MRNVFFRSPLVYLLAFITISASFFCFKSIADFYSPQTGSSKERKFNFGDYDVKSPEVVREKLSQLFPKGSNLSEFQSFMERSGSKCSVNEEKGGS